MVVHNSKALEMAEQDRTIIPLKEWIGVFFGNP